MSKFLASKRTDLDAGRLSPRTFADYHRACDTLVKEFSAGRVVADLRSDDFSTLYAKLAKRHSVTSIGREIVMVRSVFRYALDAELIERAVRFGPQFKAPSKTDQR